MRLARSASVSRRFLAIIASLILALVFTACSSSPTATTSTSSTPRPNLSGSVAIDGSSTVYPITEAMAEEFGKLYKNVKVTVGISGTGGGFKRFCAGETDISDASRPISASERDSCRAANIEYVELPVAYDGLAVLVNPMNTWMDCVTTAELKKFWEPAAQGKVTRWNQVRAAWPDKEIHLFGPGTDSGTFDFFTEVINGTAKASRGDFQASEDDNTLVQGISTDINALGYFGLAYYSENASKLKLVPVDSGAGCIKPSSETVIGGSYKPLSRPLFIYVKKSSAARPEVKAFVNFYIDMKDAKQYVTEVGYIPLPDAVYDAVSTRWSTGKTGSDYDGAPAGSTLDQLYK